MGDLGPPESDVSEPEGKLLRSRKDEDIRAVPVELVLHRPLHLGGERYEGDESPDPQEDPEAGEDGSCLPSVKILPGKFFQVHRPVPFSFLYPRLRMK